jgi:hypothetical protein
MVTDKSLAQKIDKNSLLILIFILLKIQKKWINIQQIKKKNFFSFLIKLTSVRKIIKNSNLEL